MSRYLDDNEAYAEANAREAASNSLLATVALNNDALMPSMGSMRFHASTYLGECSREAQALLFAACHEARVNDGDDKLAAACLRAFVERVADDYSEDHWEAWL